MSSLPQQLALRLLEQTYNCYWGCFGSTPQVLSMQTAASCNSSKALLWLAMYGTSSRSDHHLCLSTCEWMVYITAAQHSADITALPAIAPCGATSRHEFNHARDNPYYHEWPCGRCIASRAVVIKYIPYRLPVCRTSCQSSGNSNSALFHPGIPSCGANRQLACRHVPWHGLERLPSVQPGLRASCQYRKGFSRVFGRCWCGSSASGDQSSQPDTQSGA